MRENHPVLSKPTRSLDGEIWVQCQLRLIFRFQAKHGISLHLCDPSRRCLRIGIGEILDHRSGRAISNGMLWTEIKDEFQDCYLDHLDEMDQLEPETAERLAFNLAMDDFWDEIEESAIKYCRSVEEANKDLEGAP